jgi:hypothetical protein
MSSQPITPSRKNLHRFCDEFDIHVSSLNLTTLTAHLMVDVVNIIMFDENYGASYHAVFTFFLLGFQIFPLAAFYQQRSVHFLTLQRELEVQHPHEKQVTLQLRIL